MIMRLRAIAVALEPAALVLLLATLALEAVLVIPTQYVIPPYITVLPVLALVALLLVRSPREFMPEPPLSWAVGAWLAVTALSLVMWLVHRPPHVGLAGTYGSLRASLVRGPTQLAITFAFLAALPLVLVLARRLLAPAVAVFVGIAVLAAAFGIWQVIANRLGLPTQNISNDPLVSGRAIPGWRGLLRPYSTFGEPSPFAAYLLGPLAVSTALAIWPPSRRVRVAAAICGTIAFAAFVLTLATGAWSAVPVALAIVFVLLAHRRTWWGIPAVVAAMVVVAVITLAPLLALNEHRASANAGKTRPVHTTTSAPADQVQSGGITAIPSTIIGRIRDSIATGRSGPRLAIQRYQVTLWESHPLLGVGIGAADLYTAHHFRQNSLTSTYGVWPGVLSETGTLGAVTLLFVVASFAFVCARALRAAPSSPWYPVVAGALVGVIAEFVAYFWFYERIPASLWTLMGLGVLAARRARAVAT
jgi:hypothetical protein